jgi:hypothetical protein
MKYKTLFPLYTIVVFVLAYIFFRNLAFYVATDIQPHAEQVLNLSKGFSSIPPNFLYYIVVWFFAGFSTNIETIKLSSAIVLSLAVTFKFGVTQHVLRDYLEKTIYKTLNNRQLHFILILSAFLLIVFTIPDSWYYHSGRQTLYLGRLVPNVWHNSTIIFLFPLALLLFWEQCCILFFDKKINLWWLSLLIFLNIATKPSFFLQIK